MYKNVVCKIRNKEISDKSARKVNETDWVSKDIVDFVTNERRQSFVTIEEIKETMDELNKWKSLTNKVSRTVRKKAKKDSITELAVLNKVFELEKKHCEENLKKDRLVINRKEHMELMKLLLSSEYLSNLDDVKLETPIEMDLTDREYQVIHRYLLRRSYNNITYPV